MKVKRFWPSILIRSCSIVIRQGSKEANGEVAVCCRRWRGRVELAESNAPLDRPRKRAKRAHREAAAGSGCGAAVPASKFLRLLLEFLLPIHCCCCCMDAQRLIRSMRQEATIETQEGTIDSSKTFLIKAYDFFQKQFNTLYDLTKK